MISFVASFDQVYVSKVLRYVNAANFGITLIFMMFKNTDES